MTVNRTGTGGLGQFYVKYSLRAGTGMEFTLIAFRWRFLQVEKGILNPSLGRQARRGGAVDFLCWRRTGAESTQQALE